MDEWIDDRVDGWVGGWMGRKAVENEVIPGESPGLVKGRSRRWNSSSDSPGRGGNMSTQTRAPGEV